MTTTTVTLHGDFSALDRLLPLARGAAVRAALVKAAEVVATQVALNIQELDIVDTGNLLNSVQVEALSDDKVVVYVGAEYGIYIEFGTGIWAEDGQGRKTPWVYWNDKLQQFVTTRGREAQPYFRPAIDEKAKTLAKVIGAELRAQARARLAL